MKKLLLTGLAALSTAALFASPMVYEVTIKAKTTVAKSGKISADCYANGAKSDVTYRKQGNISIKGLIWVCDCDSMLGPLGFTRTTDDGCFFWDETNGKPLYKGTVAWPVLHRIDNKMKKAEGVMELAADGWHLMLAGIGRAESFTNSVGRLIMLKGNIAGYRTAPTWRWTEYGAPCTFCDSGTADIQYEDTALAWPICSCSAPSDFTFVSGTWSIKFNKQLSAKLNDATEITSIYQFPGYVKNAMAETPAPTPATPTQTTPTETTPTETTPAETTPTETIPTEPTPSETTPTETPPTEPTPSETTPTEPTPTEPTPATPSKA